MKRVILAAALMGVGLVAQADPAASAAPAATAASAPLPSALSTNAAQVSYTIGFLTGKANMQRVPDMNIDTYMMGFRDAFGGKQLLSEDQMKTLLTEYQRKMAEAEAAKAKAEAEENAKKSAAYLADNAKKAGVLTTASGLQYQVVTTGKGPKPKPTDKVKVNYEGRLIDGTLFDSSIQRGEPASFALDQVIPGWTEALQLMPVGSKFKLTIPASLGYGEQGAGPIPPNSVLLFDVELLDILKPDATDDSAKK